MSEEQLKTLLLWRLQFIADFLEDEKCSFRQQVSCPWSTMNCNIVVSASFYLHLERHWIRSGRISDREEFRRCCHDSNRLINESRRRLVSSRFGQCVNARQRWSGFRNCCVMTISRLVLVTMFRFVPCLRLRLTLSSLQSPRNSFILHLLLLILSALTLLRYY